MQMLAPPRWLIEQPDYAAPLNPDHVRAGLEWFIPGTRVFYTASGPRFLLSTGSGPKFRRESGRAGVIGFGSTYGTNGADVIRAFVAPRLGPYVTLGGKLFINGQGGSGLGRVFQVGESGAFEGLFMNGGGLSYLRDGTTTDAQYTTSSAFPTGAWTDFDLTHDQSAVGIAPLMWVNSVSAALSTNSASSGAYVAITNEYVNIGNRPSDVARGGDLMLGPFWKFGAILSDRQRASLRLNPYQMLLAPRRMHNIGFVGSSGLAASITEPASAADSENYAFGAAPTITEAATSASSQAAAAAQSAAITETTSLGESTGGSATGDYTGTRTEAASLDSTATQVWAGAATQTEAASAAETCGVVLGKAVAASEGASLDSSQLLSATLAAIIAEAMSLAAAQSQQAYGHFICDTMENGSGSVWASTAAKYNWLPSWRIGDALPSSGAVAGSGTFDASGVLSVLLPLGQSGVMMYSKPNTDAGDDDVAYMHGTVV
jgi:hypothetical protein